MKTAANILKTGLPLGMARILFIALLFVITSQGFGQSHSIKIKGIVTNEFNGLPIANKTVILKSDTSGNNSSHSLINKETVTDFMGIYSFDLTLLDDNVDLQMIVFDCHSERHDTTFTLSKPYQDIYVYNFIICGPVNLDCEPNFEAILIDSSYNRYKYKFFDRSNEGVVKWEWDFGDNTGSAAQHPEHVYSKPGLYKVTLSVSTALVPDTGCSSSITKLIYAGSNHSFGGHVFTGLFPIDLGIAYLYKFDNNTLVPIDTAIIDTLGFYYFVNKVQGDYLVRATPDPRSVSFNEYVSTYYPDALYWEDATAINLDTTGWEYDLHLIAANQLEPGSGKISGNVMFIDSLNNPTEVAQFVEVFVINENDVSISSTLTDEEGLYYFEDIHNGIYTVRAETPGATSTSRTVVINNNNLVHDDIEIELKYTPIIYDIEENQSEYLEIAGSVYPNPSYSKAFINVNVIQSTDFDIEVYNQIGQRLTESHYSMSRGNHQIPVNTQTFDKGIYFIRILTEDKFVFIQKLIRL